MPVPITMGGVTIKVRLEIATRTEEATIARRQGRVAANEVVFRFAGANVDVETDESESAWPDWRFELSDRFVCIIAVFPFL